MNTALHNGLTCSLEFSPLNPRNVGKEEIPKPSIPARQSVFSQPPSRLPTAADPNKDSGSRSTPGDLGGKSLGQEKAVMVPRPNEPTGTDTPRETIGPVGRAVDKSQERVSDIEKTGEADSALPDPPQVQQPRRERHEIPEYICSRVPPVSYTHLTLPTICSV